MTTYRRLLALIITCALVVLMPAQALAEFPTVYVRRDDACVYDQSGMTIATVSANTPLKLTGMRGSVCRVSHDGKTGYMKKADLSASPAAPRQAAPAMKKTVYVGKATARVYNLNGDTIASLPANTQLVCTAVKGKVCQVTYNGKTGYMLKADLTSGPVQLPEAALDPVPVDTPSLSQVVYAARDDAPVYNAEGKAVNAVAANTRMTCTAVKDGICRVELGGRTGYMKKADLSDSPVSIPEATPEATLAPAPTQAPATVNATAYVSTDNAKVYNAKGKVINYAALNTEVTVVAVKDGVCKVKAQGGTGYMRFSDLSTSKTEPAATAAPETICQNAYVGVDGAKVYDSKGSVIATMKLNAEVTVTAANDGVCRVTSGGHTGYMRAADLSCDKVAQETNVVDIPNTTGYVNKDGAKVYDASGSTIATLDTNAEVTVSAYNDTLVQVVKGSTVGYMSKSDISTSKVQTTSPSYTLKRGDTGEAVKRVQARLRDLGYFSGVIGGNYKDITEASVRVFQEQAKLEVTGVCDAKTLEALFSDSAPKMPQTADNAAATSGGATSGKSTVTPAKGTAKEMDWWTSGIQKIFARGTTATITDVETGLAWREQRRGGTNHADVQPLTAADTAVLKRVYGGKWSWNRRAIFVTINGVNYAASMNGMPHGGGSISGNNFNGHHCIHFTNSRTHGSNKVCSLHQNAIKKALAAKL